MSVAGARRIRVLLVEDNPGDARLVEMLLSEAASSAEFEIVRAGTLGEALARLRDDGETFEAILLDLSLPDSVGLETVRWMREATPHTPMVVLSGQDDEMVALRAVHMGAQDYLIKGRGDGEVIARSVRYSVERSRIEETLRERERRLEELVGKLISAQEEERRRVAYDIHDGLTQVAIAARHHLQTFAEDHPPGSVVEEGELDRAIELMKRTVEEARRVISGLRPTILDDYGLAAAIRAELDALRRNRFEVGFEEDTGGERLSAKVETTLYRVAQEALNNARKHARASRVEVSLRRNGEWVRLEVRDTGRGFDPAAVAQTSGSGERVGLASMRERVVLLGGRLAVRSRPGEGTSVVAEVPLRDSGGTGD